MSHTSGLRVRGRVHKRDTASIRTEYPTHQRRGAYCFWILRQRGGTPRHQDKGEK